MFNRLDLFKDVLHNSHIKTKQTQRLHRILFIKKQVIEHILKQQLYIKPLYTKHRLA